MKKEQGERGTKKETVKAQQRGTRKVDPKEPASIAATADTMPEIAKSMDNPDP